MDSPFLYYYSNRNTHGSTTIFINYYCFYEISLKNSNSFIPHFLSLETTVLNLIIKFVKVI